MFKFHGKTGHYVSELGQVKKKRGEGFKVITTGTGGYSNFSANGKNHLLHRVVWEAFNGVIPPKMCINHINGIKNDNRLTNLELVTYKENYHHGLKLGLINPSQPAEKNAMAKLTNEQYLQIINMIMIGKNNQEIANTFNLHPRYISLIRGKKRLLSIWEQYELTHGVYPVPMSGEKSKLSLETRLQILSELPKFTNKFLANKYELDPSVISNIRYKKTWLNIWEIFDKKCNDHSERK